MFRNRKYNSSFSVPCKVFTEVEETNFNKDGVKVSKRIVKEVDDRYPQYSDYKLSSLISAGVPLNPVSPIFNDTPSDADIDKIDKSLDGYQERIQKEQEPTEPTEPTE